MYKSNKLHGDNYTSFVGSVLVHKMEEGGEGAYFKFCPIGEALIRRGAYSRGGANSRIYGSCELPICFGILKFFVSNLILTLFRNIAKSEYHHLEFQNSLRYVFVTCKISVKQTCMYL